MPAKTAKKAENYSKEGPINTTVCKSGDIDSVELSKLTRMSLLASQLCNKVRCLGR